MCFVRLLGDLTSFLSGPTLRRGKTTVKSNITLTLRYLDTRLNKKTLDYTMK